MRSVIAKIREHECIGCTKCIQACPVDAIVGAAKLMHTVIDNECIGCELCVKPCPVDCIDLIQYDTYTGLTGNTLEHYKSVRASHTKERLRARNLRLANAKQQQQEHYAKMKERLLQTKEGDHPSPPQEVNSLNE